MIAASLFLSGVDIDRREHDDFDAVMLRSSHSYIAIHVGVEDIEHAEQLAAKLTTAAARMRARVQVESSNSSPTPDALPNVAAPYDARILSVLRTASAPGLTALEVVKAMFPNAAPVQVQRLHPQISGVLTRMAREGVAAAKNHRYMLAGARSAA